MKTGRANHAHGVLPADLGARSGAAAVPPPVPHATGTGTTATSWCAIGGDPTAGAIPITETRLALAMVMARPTASDVGTVAQPYPVAQMQDLVGFDTIDEAERVPRLEASHPQSPLGTPPSHDDANQSVSNTDRV